MARAHAFDLSTEGNSGPVNSRLRLLLFATFLSAIFLFRCFYGINLDFWNADEKHIYLLGLEWFTTGEWPYFGPDVVHNGRQIAGALQSVLIGLPFYFWASPLAPFVLLNLLSLAGLMLLARYLSFHFPNLSFTWTLLWLSSLPWTLEIGTHIYNPSYLLFSAVLFFLGFVHTIPFAQTSMLGLRSAFFLMGFALTWSMQLHLSWPILLPFLLLGFALQSKTFPAGAQNAFFLGVGALLPFLLLVPTIVVFGPSTILNAGADQVGFFPHQLLLIFSNLARLGSYASYESMIFVGENWAERLLFLGEMPILWPLFCLMSTVWVLQVVHFYRWLVQALRKREGAAFYFGLMFCATLLWVTFLFALSARPPISRNLYLLLPFCLLGVLWSMQKLHLKHPRLLPGLVVVSLFYHGLIAWNRYSNFQRHSLLSNTELLEEAIAKKAPTLFETHRYAMPLGNYSHSPY